ncbi:TetR/AcrR family transcriptional regulator [Mycolicibacterium cosmeticum]|uniref:TetR/AcrR family transcriptional regulator n=1 Tax=Mycolicibacterium cosmeticum TaxID=258533 RepID=UPI0032046736
MQSKAGGAKRSRGRPPGGGKTADQSYEALLDAAERCLKRGYRGATMEAIGREAGCSRTIVYRHFATRDELMDAVMMRRTAQLVAKLVQGGGQPDVASRIVEAIVMFVTELAADPIYLALVGPAESGTVTDLPARMSLTSAAEAMLVAMQHSRGKTFLRKDLRPADAAHHLISATLGILAGLVPGARDPEQIRRYVRVFVLPAVLAEPPPVEPVFQVH